MTDIILGRRGENRLGQLRVFAQARRKPDSVDLAGLLILPPAAAGNAAAHNAFNVNTLCFADDHNAVSERLPVLHDPSQLVHINMHDVVLHQLTGFAKPERA
ncbi:hypothetical protein D3C74_414510 [compost metagenome]